MQHSFHPGSLKRQQGRVRWLLLSVLLLIALVSGLAAWRPSLPAGRADEMILAPASPVRATFVGVSTLMFDDGEQAVMVDGFFSRPGLLKTAFGRVGPDEPVIRDSLKRLGVLDGPLKLLAVVTAHSHYDHAMDAPVVARLTGAMLVGSESTRLIGLGQGLPETQVDVPGADETLVFGPFALRMIPSIHSPTPWNDGHDGGELTQALIPPVHASRYLEGGSFSLYFEYRKPNVAEPSARWLVQGSAGFVERRLDPLQADTVFLGVGTLGRKRSRYKESYWLETVTAVGARCVVPVHWDDFTVGLERALKPLPYWLDNVHSTERFLAGKIGLDGVGVHWMQAWETLQLPAPVEKPDPLLMP